MSDVARDLRVNARNVNPGGSTITQVASRTAFSAATSLAPAMPIQGPRFWAVSAVTRDG